MVNSKIINLLLESRPYIITVETKNGYVYRGKVKYLENNMNFCLENVAILNKKKYKVFNSVFIRGNSVVIITLPDLLKEAPLFKMF